MEEHEITRFFVETLKTIFKHYTPRTPPDTGSALDITSIGATYINDMRLFPVALYVKDIGYASRRYRYGIYTHL